MPLKPEVLAAVHNGTGDPSELSAPSGEPAAYALTEDERDLYQMLQQLDRQTFELHIAPLQQRFQKFLRRVEARLGLAPGELASGAYDLDGEAGRVTRRAEVPNG